MNEIARQIQGLQHVGIPSTKMEESKRFYHLLGFEPVYETINGNQAICFLRQGGLTLELYEVPEGAGRPGAIDHLALEVQDPEQVQVMLSAHGYEPLEGGVKSLPFWKNGIRYFTVMGPNGEKIEFASHAEE